jgi:hypothetical protein
MLSVPITRPVSIEQTKTWIPELSFPKKEPWKRLPVLELDFAKVAKSGACQIIPGPPFHTPCKG